MRTRVRLVAMVVAVYALVSAEFAHAQRKGRESLACTATPAAKAPVRMPDGGSVFVEPQTVSTSGERILVAGRPTAVWFFKNRRLVGAALDSIVGIVVSRDGRATPVPSPLASGRVHAVRAAPYEDGQWAVVFVEAAPLPRPSSPIKVEAYWFGVTDGARWLRMERLPAVEGKLNPDFASSLVRTERGFAFAVPVATEAGDRAAVFSERRGQWSVALVTDGATYASLATDGRELMLAAVAPDTVGRDPATAWSDHNSLLVYRSTELGTLWSSRVRLIRGADQPVHHPRLVWSGRGLEIGWIARGGIGGETRIGAISDADTLLFASRMAEGTQHIASTTGANGRPFWVTMNVASDGSDIQTLHVWTVRGGRATQVIGVQTPFDGVVGFSILGSRLIVIGPIRGVKPTDPPVALHMHAFTLHCD